MVPGLTFSENFPLMSVTVPMVAPLPSTTMLAPMMASPLSSVTVPPTVAFCGLFWAAARVGGSPIGAERHSSIDAVSANFVLNPSCIVVMVL